MTCTSVWRQSRLECYIVPHHMRTDHSGLYVVEFTHHKNGNDSSRALRVEGLAEEFRSLNAAKRRKKKRCAYNVFAKIGRKLGSHTFIMVSQS